MTYPRRNRHRGAGSNVRRTVAALSALVEPLTVTELAARIGVHWRGAYRLVEQLRASGAPIERYGVKPTSTAHAWRYRLERTDVRAWGSP